MNFEIVPSNRETNKYEIHRQDGTIAESTLSEGEVTFITFLYFLQLTKGSTAEDSISEERILIIDDPVSSLDSNVLFVVSSLIKEVISNIRAQKGNIKQLILLTHNVYFHKEVSFDGRTERRADTHYWILRKRHRVSTIEEYGMENPIQSSYQLLWKEIKNVSKNSSITIQNTMRRIIENYFKIMGRYREEDIVNSFQNFEEQLICRSLVSWINDGSHSMSDDLYVEQQDDSTDRYLKVFRNIFINTGHEAHYNMMYGVFDDPISEPGKN